ncbi:MAG: citrate lyase ACP [Ignavibacteria bacterium]|nr:MAG: citrate lyase ACP [Ignavibacteria bacterium]
MKISVGKRDKSNRSDCFVELTTKRFGGIKLELTSKVAPMYKSQIEDLIFNICRYFDIRNLSIVMEDYGALPFTMAARFETALKRLYPDLEGEFLLPMAKHAKYKSQKERLRRSRLYLPGNSPKFFVNAGLHQPDGIILDLEDSVAPSEKDAARLLVRNALRSVNFYGSERMVRINQLPMGLDDLDFIIPHNVHVVLIPKVESKEQIHEVEEKVLAIKKAKKIRTDIYFMPIIESALGVENAYEIASASKFNCALAIGLEDYTADIGAERTLDGKESFYARSKVVNAAKAAGIQAIDTVFSDVSDMEGLKNSVIEAKSLGFEGKGCIHPRQIKVVHEAFKPTEEEIEKAKRIVEAYEEAEKNGSGVVSIGSKMIDAPVVKRAQRILTLIQKN